MSTWVWNMGNELTAPLDDFKPREVEILRLMADGLSNSEIADTLFLSKETVRWYNKQIYSKLGTSRRTEAVALGRSMGLLAAPQAQSTASRPTLPITSGPFVGREGEIAELLALVENPEIRLVSVIAAGGMGKSRLSLELAHQIEANFRHGAAFIDLTPARKPDDLPKLALAALDVPPNEKRSPHELLLDYCREKHLLLIFDNMESALESAPLLTELLQTAPDVMLIATSRERLKLRVETVYYLQPIRQEANALFRELAAMMHPSVEIPPEDEETIERIIALVGGMPLALVLAASWVDMLSLEEIAEEIQASVDFLSADFGDMPERQRSIQAVIEPTWKRLNKIERDAFLITSLFRGGFTRAMFQAVTGSSARILQTLVGRSLVMHGYQRRYDLHPLLHQYAREKLAADSRLASAKAEHLKAFLHYAEEQNQALFAGQYLESLAALDAEQDNFRAAFDWAFTGIAPEEGAVLALALCEFWNTRSHLYEAEQALTAALEHPQTDNLRAKLHCWRSRFLYRLGDMEASKQEAEFAIELAEALNDEETLARSLHYRSYHLASEEQRAALERALQLSQASQNQQLIAHSYNSLGNTHLLIGDNEAALTYYQRAQELFEAIGNLRGISMIVYNIGLAYSNLNNRKSARQYYEQSLELKRQIGDRAGIARRLAIIAYEDLLEEEYEQADEALHESLAICEEIGDRERWVYAREVQSYYAFLQGDFPKAQQILEEVLDVWTALNRKDHIKQVMHFLATTHLLQKQLPQAKELLQRFLQNAATDNRLYDTWLCLLGVSQWLYHTRAHDQLAHFSAVVYREQHLGSEYDRRFFLQPHIYQVEQAVGSEAWTQAQKDAETVTLQQAFQKAHELLQ